MGKSRRSLADLGYVGQAFVGMRRLYGRSKLIVRCLIAAGRQGKPDQKMPDAHSGDERVP